ncbi:methylmalonyl-CoA mutase, N-terminal domain [Burkholderiales bacterium]|nr:methylmalonyl-CoA mutase, N-terminal domain [Burkholderiales bacterium]
MLREDLKVAEAAWRGRHAAELADAAATPARCEDGLPLKVVYTPLDLEDGSADVAGFPGEFPYTRGNDATGYRRKLWTISHYAGFGSPRETNVLFRKMIDHGGVPPYMALDLPTQLGLDPDDPMAAGEVGLTGTSIASLRDWETIFDGIALESTFVGTVINAPAAVILAMHIVLAQKQGADLAKVRGNLQNDILKEFTARGNFIFPVAPSLRLVTDTVEYCARHLPSFWPLNVTGGHFAEAGADRVHEVAFAFADAFTYIERLLERGVPIDAFARNMFFLMKTNHFDLFEEAAKFRAMRRIWATRLRDRYGARDPESLKCKVLGHSGGSQMTRERPELNIARTTLACLAGALGGIQLIGLRTMDEVFGIPTEKSEMIAIGTQHVVAHETGVPDVVDPLGGSYYVESLTREFEARVQAELDRIESEGGVVRAIETGSIRREIARDAYEAQRAVERGDKVKVGVNKYRIDEVEPPRRPYKLDPAEEGRRVEDVRAVRRERDNATAMAALEELRRVARMPEGSDSNLMGPIIEAVRAYATMGEICGALKDVFGEYVERGRV